MLNEIEIRRDELLRIIRDNREKHLKEYTEAIEGFRPRYLKRLQDMALEGQQGTFEPNIGLTVPQKHERDYDQAIRMLELGSKETVIVDEQSFRQFVMDDWAWKASFTSTNKLYK